MIPPFNSDGNLPPGVHWATWQEFAARFGITPYRKKLLNGLNSALDSLSKAGCQIVYIDGSFVTDKLVPGDFDACWDATGVDENYLYSIDPIFFCFDNKRAAQKAKYLGEFFPALGPADSAGRTYLEFFQTDRDGNPKGIVALDLGGSQP